MNKIINYINYILLGATIIFFSILILAVILPAVLAEEPIPPFFIKSTFWVAVIWLIFGVLKRLFVKKKDDKGPILNDQNKDK